MAAKWPSIEDSSRDENLAHSVYNHIATHFLKAYDEPQSILHESIPDVHT